MANLETMRTFQQHWSRYCADEHRLARLCTQLPLRCDSVNAADRCAPLYEQPDSCSYDHQALEDALGADGARWGYHADEGTQWGWWLGDSVWQIQTQVKQLLGARASACAELAALATACQTAKNDDSELREARSTMRTYREADAQERAELTQLEARRMEVERPYTEEAARTVSWLLRPWHKLRLWLLRHVTLRDELDKLDQKLADTRAKLEVRERKLEELQTQERTRIAAVETPFDEPTDAVLKEAAATEQTLVQLYDLDLTARDTTYEQGTLEELPFEEAIAAAHEREWALLEQWMAAYVKRLPEEIVHAHNVVESELVWLEGFAPYGKRCWPLTDDVVAVMEEGRADSSDVALRLVRSSAHHAAVSE